MSGLSIRFGGRDTIERLARFGFCARGAADRVVGALGLHAGTASPTGPRG